MEPQHAAPKQFKSLQMTPTSPKNKFGKIWAKYPANKLLLYMHSPARVQFPTTGCQIKSSVLLQV